MRAFSRGFVEIGIALQLLAVQGAMKVAAAADPANGVANGAAGQVSQPMPGPIAQLGPDAITGQQPALPPPVAQQPNGPALPFAQIPTGQPGMPGMPQDPVTGSGVPAVSGPPGQAAPAAEIPKPYRGALSFEAGTGRILTLTLPAANIYVADPKVTEVRPASATSLFVFGIGIGHTNIAAVDSLGRLLAEYQVTVLPSGFTAREAQGAINRLIPNARIQVRPQGKGLMLTGDAGNQADAASAVQIAKGYLGEGGAIGNQMTLSAPTQVTLNVRIAEMQRTVIKNLGINWNAIGSLGQLGGLYGKVGIIGAITNAALSHGAAGGGGGGSTSSAIGAPGEIFGTAAIDILAQDNLAHVLAEPNLTVMSGQSASFQVGGEFPIPVTTTGGATSVTFKQYGIMVSFLPTVLNDGRINLHVKPEVSEITTANSAAVTSGTSTSIIPALTVRRAETMVELGSGESFMIAGLLHEVTSDSSQGLPGIGDTPIIGSLFRTNHLNKIEQELVIMVTPIVVRPVKTIAQLQLPTAGYATPRDVNRLLLMRQMPTDKNRVPSRVPAETGFIVR